MAAYSKTSRFALRNRAKDYYHEVNPTELDR